MNELSKEAKNARNAYQKRFRQKNPDKIREYNRRYWERRAKNAKRDHHSYEEIFALRDRGYSQRRIAAEIGISVGSVNKILNKE